MKTGLHRLNLPLALTVAGAIALVTWVIFTANQRHTQEAARRQILRKPLIEASADQQLEKFSLTGFDDRGKKAWNLEGDAAKIDSGQTVFLEQNVTLKLQDNTVIRTDHVQWSQDAGSLKTDSRVFVDHQTAKIEGIGAIGRMKDSFIQLNRKIEMIINESTRLVCEGPLKIFYKENRMIFYRKVKVTDARGVLTSDRMDVFFDSADKKVKQIVAIGHVVIVRGTDTTRSQRAIYTPSTGAIRLEGNPEVTLHKESKGLLDGPFGNKAP
jgi:lipopolysaccharide export system protein LptA